MMETFGTTLKCLVCGYRNPGFSDNRKQDVICPICEFPMRVQHPIPLEDRNMAQFLKCCKQQVICLFWAPWDPDSKEAYAIFRHQEFAGEFDSFLATIDVSYNPMCQRMYGIQILPTVLLLRNGMEINRILGQMTNYDLFRLVRSGNV